MLRSDERIKVHTKDLNLLISDLDFMSENEGKVGFVHLDIPFGYFNNKADIPFDVHTVSRIAAATLSLCNDAGTLLIKMGDMDHALWRTALAQAGWHVERDRKHLIMAQAAMRKKSFLSHAATVNATHQWLIAHKSPGDAYYQHPKPFGKGGGGQGYHIVHHHSPSLSHTHTPSSSLHTKHT